MPVVPDWRIPKWKWPGELRPLWRSHLNGSGLEAKYSGEAQPLIQDGVMYIITGADDVFAISVETGDML